MNLPEYLVMIKMYRQAHYDEDFLIDYNTGNDYYLNDCNANIPDKLKRNNLRLPDIRSSDVSRHFTKLSEMNYSVDIGTYPLGSCTMKYNPKYNDYIAGIENFTEMHPLDNEKICRVHLK